MTHEMYQLSQGYTPSKSKNENELLMPSIDKCHKHNMS